MHTPKEPRMTPRRKAVGKASPMRSTATKPRHKGHGCNEEPRMNPRRKAVGKASATLTVVAEAQGRGQGIADAQHRHRTKAQGPRMHRGTPDDPLVKKRRAFAWGGTRRGGGTNRSDKGLNLSGSWQQGHSATYNTPSRI